MATSLLCLFGCVSVPPKPSVLLCGIDYPQDQAICGKTKGSALPVAKITQALTTALPDCPEQTDEMEPGSLCRMPLSRLDKATALTPEAWEADRNYVHQLESYIQNNCGRRN